MYIRFALPPAALAAGIAVSIAAAQPPPAYPLPSTWTFVRPDVVDAPAYFSERWGIRFELPKPNVWCGTSGAADRGGYIVLRADADCRRDLEKTDIAIRVTVRWNTSGIDDDLPPIREVIARARCGSPWSPAFGVRALPRVAGLPAFECMNPNAEPETQQESMGIYVILFRGDKSRGRRGVLPYPDVEYHFAITAPSERAAEARAIMTNLLRRVELRPI